ncbi:putative membrane protein [Bradyrhizobium diazoefficiens]
MTATTFETATPGRALRIGLWAAQGLIFFVFASAGLVKLLTPIPQLAAMMPWAGQYSETFVRIIGLIDLAGGIGILLPALTRILPRLTVLAALGCTVLQVFGKRVFYRTGYARGWPRRRVTPGPSSVIGTAWLT